MATDPRTPLEVLFDAAEVSFRADGGIAGWSFGWRERWTSAKTEDGRRVVWVPGDLSGGLGKLEAAPMGGAHPRQGWGLWEAGSVYLSAVESPASKGTDERLQYRAARELFDRVAWAIRVSMPGLVELETPRWITDQEAARRGAALVVVVRVRSAIVGPVPDAVATSTRARLEVSELGEMETIVVNR